MDGGIIMYSRTYPGYHFTYVNDPRDDIAERLDDSKDGKAFGLSVEKKEVKRDETEDFYYLFAAKGNFKGSCFHATGVLGLGDLVGSKVMNISVCRSAKCGRSNPGFPILGKPRKARLFRRIRESIEHVDRSVFSIDSFLRHF